MQKIVQKSITDESINCNVIDIESNIDKWG